MPQASEEDRQRAIRQWGDIDVLGPEKFLQERGYTLTRQWVWEKPSLTHEPTEEELFAIKFLIHEWDYGGLL